MGRINQPKELPRSASADSPVMKRNAELLAQAGVTVDANGRAVFTGVAGEGGEDGGDDAAAPWTQIQDEAGLDDGGETIVTGEDEGQNLEVEAPLPEAQGRAKGLEKREQDAREAQRRMESARGALKEILEEANEAIARLATLRNGVELRIPEMNPATQEEVEEYRRLYPTEHAVMESLVKPLYEALQQVHAHVLSLVDSMADSARAKASRSSISAVQHYVPSAKQIVASEGFRTWIQGLPGAIGRLYIDVVNRTPNYEPGDILKMFKDYEDATGVAVFANDWIPGDELGFQGGVQQQSAVRPNQGPRKLDRGRGGYSGGAMPQRPRQGQGQARPDALTPLSPEEMANFRSLMANAKTPAERDTLTKRLALSNPTFGNTPYMVEGSR